MVDESSGKGEPDTPRRGRPRDEGLAGRVLAATREIVARDGYLVATVEEIAARAGVSKGSIYRRWPTKGVLVYEACIVDEDGLADLADSGDITEDLVQIASMTTRGFRSRERD